MRKAEFVRGNPNHATANGVLMRGGGRAILRGGGKPRLKRIAGI